MKMFWFLDLDEELARGNLDVLKPRPRRNSTGAADPVQGVVPGVAPDMQPHRESHYHGVSVYTYRSADGVSAVCSSALPNFGGLSTVGLFRLSCLALQSFYWKPD